MTDQRQSGGAVAKGLGVLAAVVLVNVLLRVVGPPDLGLPAVSLPDVPDWIHVVLKAKNWLLAALVVVVAGATLLGQLGRRR